MASIAMKITFQEDVQLKAKYEGRRSFVILIPSYCQLLEDVKKYLVQEFCTKITRLDICVDSTYSLRDEESIQLIQIYSNKDTEFQCFVRSEQLSNPSTADASCMKLKDPFKIPEILDNIFYYLEPKDLFQARLVNNIWNNVAIERFGGSFVLTFQSYCNQEIQNLLNMYPISRFLQGIQKFRLGWPEVESDTSHVLNLLRTFAPKMTSLKLAEETHLTFVTILFSPEVQPLLRNLKHLHINCYFTESLVANISLDFLLNVESLVIIAFLGRSDYGKINFLAKFLNLQHRLTSLSLGDHYLPKSIWGNLFNTSTLEVLRVPKSTLVCKLNDEILGLMTPKKKNSVLRILEAVIDSSASPPVFHRFLVSHRLTLKELIICGVDARLLDAFPQLEELTRLDLGVSGETPLALEGFLDSIENVLPKLTRLEITHGNYYTLPMKQIFGLKQESIIGRSTWI